MRPFLVLAFLLILVAPAVAVQPSRPAGETGDAGYYFLLARHLESLGRVDEAIKAHEQAIALDPGSAELRAELAGLYARQDNALEAVANALSLVKASVTLPAE